MAIFDPRIDELLDELSDLQDCVRQAEDEADHYRSMRDHMIVTLHKDRLSQSEIARVLGITHQAVQQIIYKAT